MARVWLGKTRTIRQLGVSIALAITVGMLVLRLTPDAFYRLEAAALDVRFKLRGERPAGDEVVLVAIDGKSLKEIGRWPWSRAQQAQLVDGIRAGRPRVIGLDIIYSESEQSDARFAASLRAAGNVVLAVPFLVPEESRSSAPAVAEISAQAPDSIKRSRFTLVRHARADEVLTPHRATDIQPPIKQIAGQAASVGHVFYIPDRDGITRYEYLALQYGTMGDVYPAFALEIARLYLGIPRDHMSLTLGEGIRLGERFIPTDQKARMLIDYVGRERRFLYVSAADVLQGRIPESVFADKAVLVGTAALGTYDQKATPFSANFPGMEKNATVVENIIHGRFLHRSLWAGVWDVGMILLCGLGLGLTLPYLGALSGAIVGVSALFGYAGAMQYLFITRGIWLDVVYPMLTITLTFVGITVLRLVTEEKQAREVKAMFSSYVSPQVVAELIRDPSKATVSGQRKELTMLFADLMGFTTFSEQHSPEEAVMQLNEFLSAMTDVIFHWHGTVDKFVGDSVVAFWGAPLEQSNHAELGVKCALHMRKRLTELQAKWRAEGRQPFDCGIGINTATAIVGNIGAEGKKIDYTMIGDQVNLAARVQELTRRYGCPIILTDSTAERVRSLTGTCDRADNQGHVGHIALRELGAAKVRGKEQSVVIYGLESLKRDEMSRIEESR